MRLFSVIRGIDSWMASTHSGKPPEKWYPVSLALGLQTTFGRSETEIAAELGVCRATISKSVIKVLTLTGLEENPAFGLKSMGSRKIYKRTNGRRRRQEEADTGPDLSVVDSGM